MSFLIKANSHCSSWPHDRIAMINGQGYSKEQCEQACRANPICTNYAVFDQSNSHSRPYYGRCDIYSKCTGWTAWSGLCKTTQSAEVVDNMVKHTSRMLNSKVKPTFLTEKAMETLKLTTSVVLLDQFKISAL